MNKYNLNLNLGSEVLGSGKTITATEVVESASSKELAREVAHLAPLVDERTAQYVLDNVLAAATQLMSEGKAVILNLDGKAGLRLYVDVKLKAGSINLAKAKELDPEVTDLTLDNISALAQKAQRSSPRRTTTSTASTPPTHSEHYSSQDSSTKTLCSSAHSSRQARCALWLAMAKRMSNCAMSAE